MATAIVFQDSLTVPATGQATSFVEIEGGPDLVVEIVGDASVHKDTRRLPPAYHAAGVAALWIADARVQPLSFRVFHRGEQEYEMAQPLADGWGASPVLGREVRLMVYDTPRGTPRYDLQIRESSTDRPRG
jgi:Uma2 family endonuclease